MAKVANLQDMVKCTDIPVLKEELISLPINGPKIRETLIQQERRLASGEEMVDLDPSDQLKSSERKKFEKQSSLKGGGGDKRGGKLFGVFQNPNKQRPYTTAPPPTAWTAAPSRLPPTPPPKPPLDSEEVVSVRPPLTTSTNFQQNSTTHNSFGNARVEHKGTVPGQKEVPVQVRPIQKVQPLDPEQVWVPGQPTFTSNAGTVREVSSSGPGTSIPPPLPVRSPLPQQHVPTSTPHQSQPAVKPAPQTPQSTGPAPPPPPPPPAFELPIPESVGEDVIHQRSALMEDIRNNKLKLKVCEYAYVVI